MSNKLLVGQYENQKVCTIAWPFVRYEVLIPEQIKGDLFVWLYLSLFTYKNEQNNLAKNSYTLSIKEDVKKILTDKFGKIIDAQTLEKIIANAEKDYVVFDDERSSLKAEVFGFLETYEELFSDKLQMKYIFQDSVTGEVVPDFSITEEDDYELRNKEATKKDPSFAKTENPNLKKPSKSAIKKAFKMYELLQKGQIVVEDKLDEEITDDSPFDEFDDEDRQEFFDTLDENDIFEEDNGAAKSQKKANIENRAIRYTDEPKRVYNLKIDIWVNKNQLYAYSPFDPSTDQWFNRCVKKARNINPELDALLKELEDLYTIKESDGEAKTFLGYKDTVSDQLKVCGPLYRLVSSMKNTNIELRRTLFNIDSDYDSRSKHFFGDVGLFLEYLIEPFKRNNADERKTYSKEAFISELDCKCSSKDIDYRRLTYNEVYKNWLEGWDHFKADIADIIISTDITYSNLMYSDFINDIFALYDLRNVNGHKKKKGDTRSDIKPAQEHLDKLLKVTRVIADINKEDVSHE